jgi:hypothetical protein
MVDQTGIVPLRRARTAQPTRLMQVSSAIDRSNVRKMVDQTTASWNRVLSWLGQIDVLRQAA